MKKSMVILCAMLLVLNIVWKAEAIVIDFDSLGLNEGTILNTQIPGLSFGDSALLAQVGNGETVAFQTNKYPNDDQADSPFDSGFFITDNPGTGGWSAVPVKPIEIQFDVHVSNLSFFVGDLNGDIGFPEIMTAKIFNSGYELLDTIQLVGIPSGGDASAINVAFTQTNIRHLTIEVARADILKGIGFGVDELSFTPIPEPTTMLLLGSGLIGLMAFRRKIRKR